MNHDMAIHPIYLADICTGTGMLGAAIDVALRGIQTVLNVERESYAAATLVARMEQKALDKAPLWDDVNSAINPQVVEYLQGFHPLIFTAGYPCQPFSFAGKRLGTKDERHIWPAIDALIGAVSPQLVFLENVPGHLKLGFAEVRRNLQNRGYSVAAGLFSANETGASHKRQRLFILAKQADGIIKGLEERPCQPGNARPQCPPTQRNSQTMADTRIRQLQDQGRRQEERTRPRSTSQAVADSQRSHGATGTERTRRQARADTGGRCERPELENALHRGCGSRGSELAGQIGGAPSAKSSGSMAHAQRMQQGQCEGPLREIRGRNSHSSEELADAQCDGLQGPEALLQGPEQPITAHVSENVAHADRINDDNRGPGPGEICGELQGQAGICDSIPIFAPGPGELDQWARLLRIDPTLEPAIRRAPDGYAVGMDSCRLRLTGNGVVPLAAAYAFVTLYSALQYNQAA